MPASPAFPASGPRPIRGGISGRRAAVVWLVAAADVALMMALVLVPDFPLILVPLVAGVVAAFGVVGAVIGTRLPRNPIGWILLITATVAATSLAGSIYATESVRSSGGAAPATVAIAFVSQSSIYPCIGVIGTFLLLLFPDGRLPSRRWRGVARLDATMITGASVLAAVTPGTMGGSGLQNPIGIAGLAGSTGALSLVVIALLGIPCVSAIASVFLRYRGAGHVERQQLRLLGWTGVAFVALVAIGSSSIGPMADNGWILWVGGMGLVPIAVGISVLRYRLYDLDRIVSRTIGWLVVTGIIATVFAVAIVGLQSLLAPVTENNTLAVAGSTLLAAALFQPLRGRVQRTVDRRFNRFRLDADRALAAFAERARDEVDLERIRGSVVGTASAAVSPTLATVWLRGER